MNRTLEVLQALSTKAVRPSHHMDSHKDNTTPWASRVACNYNPENNSAAELYQASCGSSSVVRSSGMSTFHGPSPMLYCGARVLKKARI